MKIIPSAQNFLAVCVVSAATAIASQAAFASCYTTDQQLSPSTVSDFMSNNGPQPDGSFKDGLLAAAGNAGGGNALISMVRDLVASSPASLPVIISLISHANPAQQKAIGTGLGQAANICGRPDANFAADISTQLATAFPDPNSPVDVAYAAATGKPIGSVAGGGAGGGVSGGSVGGSTTPVTASFSGGGTPFNFPQGGAFPTPSNISPGIVSPLGAPSVASSVSR